MPDWIAYAFNPLKAYCDAWCLQVWEVIGAWVAGLATSAAVIVSLYLARRDSRIDLRVTATVGLIFGDPRVSHTQEHVWIHVTNVGRRAATLHSIGWHTGLFPQWMPWLRRRHALQRAEFAGNTQLPAKLADGDTASFMIPLEEWAGRVAADLAERPHWLSVHFIHVQAHTSTGDSFSRQIAPSLRRAIVQRAAAAGINAPETDEA